jgi:uncharacterized protein
MTDIEASISFPARIVVTGDTHFRNTSVTIPPKLEHELRSATLSIHTGDFCTFESKQVLERFGPILAVRGNNEDSELNRTLPDRVRISIGEQVLLLTHGHRETGRSARDAVFRTYAGKFDLVIFGHSHQPLWEEDSGTWFLNPGSPTQKRREPAFSFAVIDIDSDGHFDVQHVYFETKNEQ